MTTDAFLKAVDRHVQASEKLDYLLIAVASALLAYSVDKYVPTCSPAVRGFTLGAWVLLSTTIWLGLKRIQTMVDILRWDVIVSREPAAGALFSAVADEAYKKIFKRYSIYGRGRDVAFLGSFLLIAIAQLMRA